MLHVRVSVKPHRMLLGGTGLGWT